MYCESTRILLALVMLTAVGIGDAATRTAAANPPPRLSASIPLTAAPRWAWTESSWAGDDKPYQKARQEIDAAFTTSANPTGLVTKYRGKAKADPTDLAAIFRWCYAGYKVRNLPSQRDPNVMDGVLKALAAVPSPPPHELLRLRYLLMSQIAANDYLVALGERLAKADPNDYDVRFYLARSILPNLPGGLDKALAYSRDLMRIKPNDPKPYWMMGGIYWEHWAISNTKSREDAQQAIHYYEIYLRREKPDSPYRSHVEQTVARLKASLDQSG